MSVRKQNRNFLPFFRTSVLILSYEMAALFWLSYLNEGHSAQMGWCFTVSLGASRD